MPKYIINKSSRYCSDPYSGPTCAEAGVEEGKIYDNYQSACIDAHKLTSANKVGFTVREYYDGDRARIILTPEYPPETMQDVTQTLINREMHLKEAIYMASLWTGISLQACKLRPNP